MFLKFARQRQVLYKLVWCKLPHQLYFNWPLICSIPVLSVSLEVDVPTGDDAWKCYFQHFPDSIWALRAVKIKTIFTIFYVYYNHSFPQNLNHWLLEKSEMINLHMLIQKKTFDVSSSCCLFDFALWRPGVHLLVTILKVKVSRPYQIQMHCLLTRMWGQVPLKVVQLPLPVQGWKVRDK